MSEKDYWFISYSSKDKVIVEQLVNILISCGIAYWKAPEMIPAGSNYAKEIPKAINNCDIFLLVVSEASQNSIWVEKEIDTAIGYRKKIIPVKIDAIALSDMYRFYLNNVQIIEADVYDDGQIPAEVQETLRLVFMQNIHTTDNGGFKKSIRHFENRMDNDKVDTRTNAFRVNKIPMQCEYCGARLQDGVRGVYRCYRCGKEHYDDFRKIRNYLEQNGPAPAIIISRNTGVSMQTIDYYFKDEAIESVPGNSLSNLLTAQQRKNKDLWHYSYGKNDLGNRKK